MVRLVFYQPEIPQNVGTLMRLAACWGVGLDLIEPLGFVWSDARLRRAGMDYQDHACVTRHGDWQGFYAQKEGRLVALVPRAPVSYTNFKFEAGDNILVGAESVGLPLSVQGQVDACVAIPMQPNMRSLNVALAAALVLGEALRQQNLLPSHFPQEG